MTALKLETKNDCERIVKQHLEQIVSEPLARKINEGVIIEKDGQRVINRKTLATFMVFLSEQAKGTIPKEKQRGMQPCVMDGENIMSLAIHYFEEEEIIGKLYTLDGKELTPEPKKAAPQTATPAKPAKKQDAQMSLFGMMAENTPTMSEPAEEEPEEQGSPFYQCYQKFAAKYSDAVLFLRLGDFYEALGDHAIKISDALGLTLTGRDCGLKSRVPMCGVPYHAFEPYLAKLLERGYKVAIAEDLTGYHFAGENNSRIDEETGEVLHDEQDDPLDDIDTSAFDKEALCVLSDLFGEDIDVR